MELPSLVDALRSMARENSQRIAFRFENRAWSYSELSQAVDTVAAGLMERGLWKGDRVGFLLPNSPELVFLSLACMKIGAVSVPLNIRLKGSELSYILNDCRARLLVVHADLYPALQPVRSDLTTVQSIYVTDGEPPADCEAFDQLTQSVLQVSEGPPPDLDDVAAILYTSGTTARPRGVIHTHRTLAYTAYNFVAASGLNSSDVVFGMLSMSHIFGYTLQLLSPLSAGATVVVASRFDPDRVLEIIDHYRVTHLYGLPLMFESLARHSPANPIDLHSLRYCLAGGDMVSQRLNALVYAVLGVELHEGCGMTEVLPYALNRPGMENRVGSIGRPSLGMSLRLVDEAGQEIADGRVGEIQVQSRAMTPGYWEDPEATRAAFQDGWFRTGDLGRRDSDGYYWFVGRSKEIIVRGGSNISPLEVEAAMIKHPAIQDVAVVGIPDPNWGETVAAYIVLKPAMTVTLEEIRQFAAKTIADYKLPERVAFIADLPRGLTGKIHRKTLKEMAAHRL